MNRLEQEKITKLRGCRMGFATWDADFVNSLAAILQMDAKPPLTARQKFMLDTLVYKYRRQLAGKVSFELPKVEPQEVDYVRGPAAQGALFT